MQRRIQLLNSKSFELRRSEGNFIDLLLKRRADRIASENDLAEVEEKLPVKKAKLTRDSDGYDPRTSRESAWYHAYVGERSGQCMNPLKKRGKKFRRRFRMPMASFRALITEIREDNWFPTYEKKNALGDIGVPLELLVLGALRYLGRGWTFDD